MTRLTAKDFPQELLNYYDYYAHGKISKREFLQVATKYAVGGVTELEAALKAHNKVYEAHIYPGLTMVSIMTLPPAMTRLRRSLHGSAPSPGLRST